AGPGGGGRQTAVAVRSPGFRASGNSAGTSNITIPAEPVRLRLTNVPTAVSSGGGSFFQPWFSALVRIAADRNVLAGPHGVLFKRRFSGIR
ncbi:MAG TPA: hypothetical protein VHN14_33630, partial [Kofleriaceae bacterium]|nr:hypothetical protein [Kofleriaceae bacterium]